MTTARKILVTCTFALAAACAAQTDESAQVPVVAEGTLQPSQTVTTPDGYTMTALKPTASVQNSIRGGATFTGPGPRQMGTCLLQMTTTACARNPNEYDQNGYAGPCIGAIPNLPSGGVRYCLAPDNVGQAYCAWRGNYQTSCAGSPTLPLVNGAPPPINTGTYYTPNQGIPMAPTTYVSLACMNMCRFSDPSVSSPGTSVSYCKVPATFGCSADYCVDVNCDGSTEYCMRGGRTIRC